MTDHKRPDAANKPLAGTSRTSNAAKLNASTTNSMKTGTAKSSAKASTAKQKKSPKKKRSVWKTIRWFVIPILFVIALITGLVLGYSYIGGEEASDVFQVETWKHLVDLIFAE